MRLSPTQLAALLRAVAADPSARSYRDEGEVTATEPTIRALVARGLVERPHYAYGDRRRYSGATITEAGRAAVATR